MYYNSSYEHLRINRRFMVVNISYLDYTPNNLYISVKSNDSSAVMFNIYSPHKKETYPFTGLASLGSTIIIPASFLNENITINMYRLDYMNHYIMDGSRNITIEGRHYERQYLY